MAAALGHSLTFRVRQRVHVRCVRVRRVHVRVRCVRVRVRVRTALHTLLGAKRDADGSYRRGASITTSSANTRHTSLMRTWRRFGLVCVFVLLRSRRG